MKKLNRDVIKYIAIILMLMDHIIQVFPVVTGLTYDFLDSLSHFTFITMCFFLVEGFYYTSSRKNYVKRILIFAAISEIPYCLAFSDDKIIYFVCLNIFFNLGMSLGILWVLDEKKNYRYIYIIGCFIISFICDWMFFGPIFTLLFYWARNNKKRLALSYIIAALSFGLISSSLPYILISPDTTSLAIRDFFISMIGIALSGFFILFLYNGKKMDGLKKFNKWFFYIFYPTHLLIIGLIRIFMLDISDAEALNNQAICQTQFEETNETAEDSSTDVSVLDNDLKASSTDKSSSTDNEVSSSDDETSFFDGEISSTDDEASSFDGEISSTDILTSSMDSSSGVSIDGEEMPASFIIVEASGNTGTLTFYEIDSLGHYQATLSTTASIGANGIGKTKEGDRKTPTGQYSFIKAFGNCANPGCLVDYTQVDDTYYWVDDSNSKYYNQFVSTSWSSVSKDWSSAEHISAVNDSYDYVLALDYNSSCTKGLGSAIFLHCTPTSGAGCIAIDKNVMKTIITSVSSDSVIIIDSSENISNYRLAKLVTD